MTRRRPYCPEHLDEARRVVDFSTTSSLAATVVLGVQLAGVVVLVAAVANGGGSLDETLARVTARLARP